MINQIIKEDLGFIVKGGNFWDILKNKTFLFSGANGFLPAYMIDTLIYLNELYNLNIKIIGIVRNFDHAKDRFSYCLNGSNFRLIHQDICSPLNLDNDKIDYIIHAASQASPKYYHSDPVGTILPNVIGTFNLLKLAKKCLPECFLFFSSGEIYGKVDDDKLPINENDYGIVDPTNYYSCYAESKKLGENLCLSYHHQYNVPVKIVRPFHTYGPGMKLNDGRVFADFVSDVINSRDIILKSDGSAERSFCYLADATLAFFIVLIKGEIGQAYNVGSEFVISIFELAKIVINIFPDLELKVTKEENNNSLKSSKSGKRIYPDISKIKSLGWSAKFNIPDGFKRTILSYKK